jgi:predicted ester cyclase
VARRPIGHAFERAFSQSKHVLVRQVAEDDWVVSVFRWSAVHTGEFNGVAATGRPVAIDIVQMDRIAEQSIVEHHGYADVMSLMQQLGAMPSAT